MVDAPNIPSTPQRQGAGRLNGVVSGWHVLALSIAAIVLVPVLAIVWMALFPADNIWPHLASTTLPRYLKNSVVMMASVGGLSALVGTVTAWLVVMYRFPGRGVLQWGLLLPLALPAYISAFAVVEFLEFAGPVQTGLRSVFGWKSPRDYMFPEVRSLGMAIVVMSFALAPYVYFLARAVFRSQSGAALEVARALGQSPVSVFWRVGLPLARPAIVAGVAIVMMETLNEFGAMEFFGVQTLTTGIFTIWLEASNAGGAAQLACVILGFVMVLVVLEKASRKRVRFFETAKQSRPLQPQILTGKVAVGATVFCTIPVIFGFVLPFCLVAQHGFSAAQPWADAAIWAAAGHTLLIAGLAAVFTVLAALFLVFGLRLSRARGLQNIVPVTTIGYAAPGAVLGLGILLPLAWVDHRIADLWLGLTGADPGLLLVGSAFAIILACSIRFFALGVGTLDAAFGKIPPNLGMAAQSLGKSPMQTLRYLYLPLLRGSAATAALLVFVDSAKELPATLLLYNEQTLATAVFNRASLEDFEGTAPAALMIVAISLIAVAIVHMTNRDR